jgi:thioredoxin reductase (NADPH)
MATPSPLDTRREQMFPVLAPGEVARLRRFGEPRAYAAGEAVTRMGEAGRGLTLVVSGELTVTQPHETAVATAIVTYGPGQFMGELSQLTGRPSMVDGLAATPIEAILIPPERLRALMIAEAELGETIMRALILRRVALLQIGGGPVIVGRAGDADVLRLETFLSRNGQPHRDLDPETDAEARALVERFQVDPGALPIVVCPGGQFLRNPTERQLARCMGMITPIDPARLYDVAIVGAGPAGLAASVYAASEGLDVLTLDTRAFGGQAGASSRIENYLGFPTGISGMALMARAYNQALKFGVDVAIPDAATGLSPTDEGFALTLDGGESARARAVVVAAGARYRRLDLAELSNFEGSSVHYWASPIEARLCAGQEVALVGGGNSAGQAVVFLAGHVRKVWLVVRGAGLEASMSSYLIDRISQLANVELVPHTELTHLEGEGGALSHADWRDVRTGKEIRRAVEHVFLFIGAQPNTEWLAPCGARIDAKGFLLAGADAGPERLPYETSVPGVFAVGDVRAGSVKRLSAAVGEGAQVVASLHAHLAKETQHG